MCLWEDLSGRDFEVGTSRGTSRAETGRGLRQTSHSKDETTRDTERYNSFNYEVRGMRIDRQLGASRTSPRAATRPARNVRLVAPLPDPPLTATSISLSSTRLQSGNWDLATRSRDLCVARTAYLRLCSTLVSRAVRSTCALAGSGGMYSAHSFRGLVLGSAERHPGDSLEGHGVETCVWVGRHTFDCAPSPRRFSAALQAARPPGLDLRASQHVPSSFPSGLRFRRRRSFVAHFRRC